MSASLEEEIRIKIRDLLKEEEEATDLDNLSVLSRVGMKVSSADSIELNADATSASSTALIDLGLRLSESTNHGSLKEIILHNKSGYSILMAINDEYIIFGALNAMYRIGYYLGYLRELSRKLNYIISGGELTEMTLSLEEEELEKIRKQKEKEEEEQKKEQFIAKPSVEQDKEALDGLLGFLDKWEKEGLDEDQFQPKNEQNIVSIPGETIKPIETMPTEAKMETIEPSLLRKFPVYEDEIPPVPLDDYEPMEVGEEPSIEEKIKTTPPIKAQAPFSSETQEPLSSEELPSLEELTPPDFDSQIAKEYDTDFILEEESESLDAVLKELGWDEEEEE